MMDGTTEMCAWLKKAHQVVNTHHPTIDWTTDTEETRSAEKHLDFMLGAYFCSESNIGNIKLQDVSEAWRRYYRAHLPKGTQ